MKYIAEGDYRMQHQAPDADYGAPLHDVNDMMPDFYSHPEYYHTGQDNFWDSANKIRSAKDQPEKHIRIYRSLPGQYAHEGFHTGDWVSTSKEYARDHGRMDDAKDDWPVISTRVPAKHLHTEGDVHEWAYNGPEKNSGHTVAFKGGHHQEIRQRADGTIAPVKRKPKKENPLPGWDIKHYKHGEGTPEEHHDVVAYDPEGNWAARLQKGPDVDHFEAEPEHAHLPVEEQMRAKLPPHMSAMDRDFQFHVTATWADVRAKAKRLRAEGAVRIAAVTLDGVSGEVQGEHHIYETGLNFVPGSHKVGSWECGCKWSAYAWGRSPAYRRFEGRMCSHALAMQFEAQARGMFGKDIHEDQARPKWLKQHSPVVIQYERPSDKHPQGIDLTRRAVPPGNMRSTWGSYIGALHHEPVLPNPHTGGEEWYHGTQAYPEELSQHGFMDPMSNDPDAYDAPESEPSGHWNALLGTHVTSDHAVARQFAKGEHESGNNGRADDGERPVYEGIVHARVHLRNPKMYESEHDIDHDAYQHEFAAGNHPSHHVPEFDSDDEEDHEIADEGWPNAHRLHQDYGHDKIPAGDYTPHGTPGAGHPERTLWLNTHPDRHGIAERFRDHLKAQGHDGIVYGNEYEVSEHGRRAKSAIAFDPDHVEITHHHPAEHDDVSPEQMAHERARQPGSGQQSLPGMEGGLQYEAANDDDPVYLRFGSWPKNERSRNNVTGFPEDGVSVYDLDHHGNPMDPDPHFGRGHEHDESCDPDCDMDAANNDYGNDTHEEMQGRVRRAEQTRYRGNENHSDTGHLVKGDMAAIGHDGEPLLRNVRRVGDWIDHRHLLVPGAEKHRLARDPEDPDYEPPAQRMKKRTGALDPEGVYPDDHGLDLARSPADIVARAVLKDTRDPAEAIVSLRSLGMAHGDAQDVLRRVMGMTTRQEGAMVTASRCPDCHGAMSASGSCRDCGHRLAYKEGAHEESVYYHGAWDPELQPGSHLQSGHALGISPDRHIWLTDDPEYAEYHARYGKPWKDGTERPAVLTVRPLGPVKKSKRNSAENFLNSRNEAANFYTVPDAEVTARREIGMPHDAAVKNPPAISAEFPEGSVRSQDARADATKFGEGVPDWHAGPIIWCDACEGIGCGHCGGTGQVINAGGTTVNPIPDQNDNAGQMIRQDGLSVGGARHHAQDETDWHQFDTNRHYRAGRKDGYAGDFHDAEHLNAKNESGIGLEPHEIDYLTGHAHGLADARGRAVAPSSEQIFREHGMDKDTHDMELNFRESSRQEPEGPSVAGVALKAADTGRVLMLQRGYEDEKDPARGTWEFPGGHLESGDKTSLHGAMREWEEEVGQPFPEGGTVHHVWTSPNGIYQGHVVVIPRERSVALHDGHIMPNPDDPKGDKAEQAAWWDVDHARKNPALRPELKKGTPWNQLKSVGVQKQADYAANDPFSAEESNPEPPPLHSNTTNPASSGFATSVDPSGWNGEAPFGNRDDAPMANYQAALAPPIELAPVLGEWGTGQMPVIFDRSGTLHDHVEPALPSTDGDLEGQYGDPSQPYTGDSEDELGTQEPDFEDEGTPSSVTASRQDEYDPDVANIVAQFQATAAAGSLMSSGGGGGGGDFNGNDIAGAAQAFLSKTALKDFNFAEQQALINEHQGGKVRARNTDNLQIGGTHYELLDEHRGAMSLDSDDLFV